ncbi:MAG: corrinoid protein [Candidatus Methanosuratus sp.]|nr:corrinoid protein [Candidatus Methanosuratincola sp.]
MGQHFMQSVLEKIKDAVVNGDMENYQTLISDALKQGHSAQKILDSMSYAMAIVGEKYAEGDYYLPQVLVSAEVFTKALEIIEPDLKKSISATSVKGKIVIGVVEGDIHDIGKKLVATLLGAAGFEVYDLGKDVRIEQFVDTAIEKNANIIGMSALMTTTMGGMEKVVKLLEEKGMKGKIKTMIGGSPITQEYAEKIGADAYGESAQKAVQVASKLMGIGVLVND